MLQLPKSKKNNTRTQFTIEESYQYCRAITADYAKTFYLATLLMPEPKRQAIWAIYTWCRSTDELVDGLKSQSTTPETLDKWETQLESVFAGCGSNRYPRKIPYGYSTISRYDCWTAYGSVPQSS